MSSSIALLVHDVDNACPKLKYWCCLTYLLSLNLYFHTITSYRTIQCKMDWQSNGDYLAVQVDRRSKVNEKHEIYIRRAHTSSCRSRKRARKSSATLKCFRSVRSLCHATRLRYQQRLPSLLGNPRAIRYIWSRYFIFAFKRYHYCTALYMLQCL